MKRSAIAVLLAAAAALTTGGAAGSTHPAGSPGLVAHEWGTFTSVAGQDGRAVEWQPFGGPDDLPCFVNQYRNKLGLWGTVRMETPVIYFYADRETSVDVNVQFRQGLVTEWFPSAATAQESPADYRRRGSVSTIGWHGVKVQPEAAAVFPHDETGSHYYTARETDAAPLRAGREAEKFLFYRGVGSFELPLTATVSTDGQVRVRNTGPDPIPHVILFSNRGGQITFQDHRDVRSEASFDLNSRFIRCQEIGACDQVRLALQAALVAEGLYEKEASAMVRTWGDSWFEEGVRVFYIVPGSTIDELLPLQISPKPEATARAFVGRLELITPDIQREVQIALESNDQATLQKFSRFLQPIGDRILAALPADTDPRPIRQRLAAARPPAPPAVPARCR